MKAFCFAVVILLAMGGFAYAQQDPDDPGIQDSVIIGSASIDSGAAPHFVNIPIYIVTDDSVAFYNIVISWASSLGGVRAVSGLRYPPFDCGSDQFDSVHTDRNYINLIGFADIDTLGRLCILYTGGVRALFINLLFSIAPDAPRQLVVLDTTWDDRNLSNLFGLIDGLTEITPAFQPGFIAIGPGVGVENEGQTPQSFSLNQNYPNPFNPSTNIAFSLREPGEVSLVIYDLLGRQVRALHKGNLGSGSYSLFWDGKNETGSDVPSGTYLYRLSTGDNADTKRMTLIR